jgi:uncharacterized protein
VTLILDTGPLYATLDRDDAAYRSCRKLVEEATEPLVIPAPVIVEVDYWIHQRLHPGILVALLDDIDAGAYHVEDLRPEDYRRAREVCDQYADADIGLVDAGVLAVTERLREPKLATLDRRHFSILRPRHVPALQLLPDAV